MQIWPGCTFGNSGRASRAPERFVKSDGIQTLVRKLRLVQSLPGRSFTRFDFFAPVSCGWRTIFRFLEKGFGTEPNHISRDGSKQPTRYENKNNRRRDRKSRLGNGGVRQSKIP